jgi:Ni/Fe-hydrogenase subunit HybB-like protein
MRGFFNLALTVILILIVVAFLQILPDLQRYLRMQNVRGITDS